MWVETKNVHGRKTWYWYDEFERNGSTFYFAATSGIGVNMFFKGKPTKWEQQEAWDYFIDEMNNHADGGDEDE